MLNMFFLFSFLVEVTKHCHPVLSLLTCSLKKVFTSKYQDDGTNYGREAEGAKNCEGKILIFNDIFPFLSKFFKILLLLK